MAITDWQILSSLVLFGAAVFIIALMVAFKAGYERGYYAGSRQEKLFGRLKLEERE